MLEFGSIFLITRRSQTGCLPAIEGSGVDASTFLISTKAVSSYDTATNT